MTREEREKALEVWYDITFDDKRFDEVRKISIEALKAEPETGHCKECKWWKDSDGVYRRGISAESKCSINRREVMEGKGYCFMFEPQESEGKE